MMKYSNRCKPSPDNRPFNQADAIQRGLDKIQLFFTGEQRRVRKPFISPTNPFAGLISKLLTFKKGK